jgi:invasion protein IalB
MIKYVTLCVCLLFCFDAYSAESNTVKDLGAFGDWQAVFWDTSEGKICSIVSYPKKEEGNYTIRGKVMVQVTLRASYPSFGVVNFKAGYPIKQGSMLNITIDEKALAEFDLLEGQIAWASDEKIDNLLIKAMKRGTNMIVQGISSRGTNTKDTYSLKGFTASYNTISKICK